MADNEPPRVSPISHQPPKPCESEIAGSMRNRPTPSPASGLGSYNSAVPLFLSIFDSEASQIYVEFGVNRSAPLDVELFRPRGSKCGYTSPIPSMIRPRFTPFVPTVSRVRGFFVVQPLALAGSLIAFEASAQTGRALLVGIDTYQPPPAGALGSSQKSNSSMKK